MISKAEKDKLMKEGGGGQSQALNKQGKARAAAGSTVSLHTLYSAGRNHYLRLYAPTY